MPHRVLGLVCLRSACPFPREWLHGHRARPGRGNAGHGASPGVLIARDAKGLYRKALRGEIAHFTGISDPYEAPLEPELVIDSSIETPEESATRVWNKLVDLGLIDFKPELSFSGEQAVGVTA